MLMPRPRSVPIAGSARFTIFRCFRPCPSQTVASNHPTARCAPSMFSAAPSRISHAGRFRRWVWVLAFARGALRQLRLPRHGGQGSAARSQPFPIRTQPTQLTKPASGGVLSVLSVLSRQRFPVSQLLAIASCRIPMKCRVHCEQPLRPSPLRVHGRCNRADAIAILQKRKRRIEFVLVAKPRAIEPQHVA